MDALSYEDLLIYKLQDVLLEHACRDASRCLDCAKLRKPASSIRVEGLSNVPDGEALALNIVAEVAAVARAKGVAVDDARIFANVWYALAHHREHRTSMLQDVLGGRKIDIEIEAINGAVVVAVHAVPWTETLLHVRLRSLHKASAVQFALSMLRESGLGVQII